MFKKIVFLISTKPELNTLALNLAKQCGIKPIESKPGPVIASRLILLALIEPKQVLQIVQSSSRKESDVREELESKAWRELYQLEHEFKESGAEVAVAVDENSLFEIQPFLRSINADLLILPVERIGSYNYKVPDEFLSDLPCPVLLIGKP